MGSTTGYDVWYVRGWDQREQQPHGLLKSGTEAVSLGVRLPTLEAARHYQPGRWRRAMLAWWYGPGISVILDPQGRRVLPVTDAADVFREAMAEA